MGAYFCRYAIYALMSDTAVNGEKYYSLFVSGDSTNGYIHFIFKRPYYRFTNKEILEWKICHKLNKNLDSYLRNNMQDWGVTSGSVSIISESYPSGYKVYIRTNDKLIFVRGFPDFGGDPPNEKEKKICE